MTADRLQAIVLRLSNQRPTRHWLHFNYPEQSPWLMAVKVYPERGRVLEISARLLTEMEAHGFEWDDDRAIWTVPRTDDDGTPFTSPL